MIQALEESNTDQPWKRWLHPIRNTVASFPGRHHRIEIAVLSIVGLVFLSVPVVSCTHAQQSQQPADASRNLTPGLAKTDVFDGWISLFDGETLFGWKPESDANWQVVDGEIRVSEGEPGLLRTTSQFDDFEIRLDFRCPSHTNSGLFLRSSPIPKDPADDCFELNISHPDDNPFPTGSLVFRAKADVNVEPDQWHRYRAIADGNQLRVWIDETKTVDYVNPKPLGRGFVGLQFRSGEIAFRNIAVKPLNQKPIFNGRDLAGWNVDKQMESQFSVTADGELKIVNGKGQIESDGQFGDFILTTKCKTNAAGLNSGIFFRCIPGDEMNGYESQIHNAFEDNDRAKPVDCGTGGIFRRQNARYVVANDNEWFTKTIVACGPHMAVWVNGYQVSDWTDPRKPDSNPRKGLRLEKGTIILQGHDPTTDLLFKDILVREMTGRRPQ